LRAGIWRIVITRLSYCGIAIHLTWSRTTRIPVSSGVPVQAFYILNLVMIYRERAAMKNLLIRVYRGYNQPARLKRQ
jgi:hypothetical protein